MSLDPKALQGIRHALGHSLTRFGVVLARSLHRKAAGFTRQYVSGLEHGRFPITPDIERAALALAAELDGVHPLMARARPVSVYSPNGLTDGVLVLGEARQCARPGCRIRFVPRSPRQIYCDAVCRHQAARGISADIHDGA